MSLQAILDAIQSKGQSQVRKIKAHAQNQADKTLAEARAEAQQLHEEACAVTTAKARRERARIIYRTNLEALQIIGQARGALVELALERTRQHLADIRADPTYPALLRHLTEEALAELCGPIADVQSVRLEADARDRALVENILSDIGLDLPVDYSLECWGGLITCSADGRVVVTNTLEARLARATPTLRRVLDSLVVAESPAAEESSVEPHQLQNAWQPGAT